MKEHKFPLRLSFASRTNSEQMKIMEQARKSRMIRLNLLQFI